MELRVLEIVGSPEEVLKREDVKRAGGVLREDLKEGKRFLVMMAERELVEKLIKEGLVKVPEDEEELKKRIEEEEASTYQGVGSLGF